MESVLKTQRRNAINQSNLSSIADSTKKTADAVTKKSQDTLNSNVVQLHKSIEKYNTTLVKSFKDLQQRFDKFGPQSAEATRNIAGEALGGRRQYNTLLPRLKNLGAGIKDFFSLRGFLDKTGIVKRKSGGIISEYLDRREERQKYVNERMKMDPYKNLVGEDAAREKFKEQFYEQQTLQGQMSSQQKIIDEQKALGFRDDQIERGENFKKQQELAGQYAKVDSRVRNFTDYNNRPDTPDNVKPSNVKTKEDISSDTVASEQADSNVTTEEERETIKRDEKRNSLLEAIATKLGGGDGGGGGGKGGGGFLKGLGDGIGGMGKAIEKLMTGVGKGFAGLLKGIAKGLAALANPATLLGLGAVTLAIMGIGKAMQWAEGFMAKFAPVLMKVVDTIGNVFITALEQIPNVITSIGDVITNVIGGISDLITGIIDKVVESVERLGNVDGSNLLTVGGGLLAVSAGLAAFGASNAIAGLGNLVSNLLSFGQDNPMEQLEKLAKFGPNLEKAGVGVEKLGRGLEAFSDIDTDKIKAIAALPVEKIAAMGKAMGGPTADQVTVASSNVEDLKTSPKVTSNVVNAPANTTNISTSSTQIHRKPDIKNQDHTLSKYRNYAFATGW